jgi:hypothetical protein
VTSSASSSPLSNVGQPLRRSPQPRARAQAPRSTPSKRRRKPLSARQVKARIEYGQRWEDREGQAWVVTRISRGNGDALIERVSDPIHRRLTFTALGREYRLLGRSK